MTSLRYLLNATTSEMHIGITRHLCPTNMIWFSVQLGQVLHRKWIKRNIGDIRQCVLDYPAAVVPNIIRQSEGGLDERTIHG